MKVMITVAVLLLSLSGCSAISDFSGYSFGPTADSGPRDAGPGTDSGPVDGGPDAGPVDGGPDSGPVPDAGMDSGPRTPTSMVQTAGGASIVTTDYQLRIYVGTPQPMGRRASATEEIVLGPGSL